jgi:hypothetical protein
MAKNLFWGLYLVVAGLLTLSESETFAPNAVGLAMLAFAFFYNDLDNKAEAADKRNRELRKNNNNLKKEN